MDIFPYYKSRASARYISGTVSGNYRALKMGPTRTPHYYIAKIHEHRPGNFGILRVRSNAPNRRTGIYLKSFRSSRYVERWKKKSLDFFFYKNEHIEKSALMYYCLVLTLKLPLIWSSVTNATPPYFNWICKKGKVDN